MAEDKARLVILSADFCEIMNFNINASFRQELFQLYRPTTVSC